MFLNGRARYGPKPVPALHRFWQKVDKNGPNGCWVWTSTRGLYYGTVIYSRAEVRAGLVSNRRVGAHRFSYELHKGPIPEGKIVRHTCDNPLCVNPDHLALGTMADNMRDCVERGRRPRGNQCSWSKITEAQVVEIKQRVSRGEVQARIAEEFGVSRSTICNIVKGKRA